jgi:hypothetical protein
MVYEVRIKVLVIESVTLLDLKAHNKTNSIFDYHSNTSVDVFVSTHFDNNTYELPLQKKTIFFNFGKLKTHNKTRKSKRILLPFS